MTTSSLPRRPDKVPDGTFCAMEQSQFAAMKHVERLGQKLATDHPEIADMYRDLETPFMSEALGENLLPEEAAISKEVVKKAVIHALGILIPEDEKRTLTRLRRSKLMHEKWDFKGVDWQEHCRKASLARHAAGIPVNVSALLSGRGRTAWTLEEKQILMKSTEDKSLCKESGHPDYSAISLMLNQRFHGGKEVRYERSCGCMVTDIRRKKASCHA